MSKAEAVVVRGDGNLVEPQPWGRLVWMVSGPLGSSTVMTVGKCFIAPGESNPRHFHPNCDEVLHVLRGTIEHSVEGDLVRMGAGDTVSIPRGLVHNARNVGDVEAELMISFDAADRIAVGE